MIPAGSPNSDAANANAGAYPQQPELQRKRGIRKLFRGDGNPNIDDQSEKPTRSGLLRETLRTGGKRPPESLLGGNTGSPRPSISRGDQNPDLDGDPSGRNLLPPVGVGVNAFAGNGAHDIPALLKENEKLRLEVATLDKDFKNFVDENRKKGSQDDTKQDFERLNAEVLLWRDKCDTKQAMFNSKEEEARASAARALSLQDQVNALQGLLAQREQELAISRHQVEEQSIDINELQSSYDAIQGQLQTASEELNVVKNEQRTVRDDEFFRTRWGRLQADIEQWAEDHFGGKRESWFFDGPTKEQKFPPVLAALCTDAKDMLKDDATRHLIIQAYVWRYIEDNFFDSQPKEHSIGLTWALRVRDELSILEEFLRPGICLLSC